MIVIFWTHLVYFRYRGQSFTIILRSTFACFYFWFMLTFFQLEKMVFFFSIFYEVFFNNGEKREYFLRNLDCVFAVLIQWKTIAKTFVEHIMLEFSGCGVIFLRIINYHMECSSGFYFVLCTIYFYQHFMFKFIFKLQLQISKIYKFKFINTSVTEIRLESFFVYLSLRTDINSITSNSRIPPTVPPHHKVRRGLVFFFKLYSSEQKTSYIIKLLLYRLKTDVLSPLLNENHKGNRKTRFSTRPRLKKICN